MMERCQIGFFGSGGHGSAYMGSEAVADKPRELTRVALSALEKPAGAAVLCLEALPPGESALAS